MQLNEIILLNQDGTQFSLSPTDDDQHGVLRIRNGAAIKSVIAREMKIDLPVTHQVVFHCLENENRQIKEVPVRIVSAGADVAPDETYITAIECRRGSNHFKHVLARMNP